jgi:hypothetical protein
MVDIVYLGFGGEAAYTLTDRPLTELVSLLNAPFLPFDGMNEAGLAIGMAAVPDGNMSPDSTKPTIDSVGIIRQMLDHAGSVEEAVEFLRSYNVSMEGGPPIHYLLADNLGKAVLVEFYQGEMIVIPNEEPWHLATNFLRADLGESAEGVCWRYDRILTQLEESKGTISPESALDLLRKVSQDGTQWSVVYGMSVGSVDVVMGRQYEEPHHFSLNRSDPSP